MMMIGFAFLAIYIYPHLSMVVSEGECTSANRSAKPVRGTPSSVVVKQVRSPSRFRYSLGCSGQNANVLTPRGISYIFS